MPICNYCSLKKIRTRAVKKSLRINALPWLGGTNIYVYPYDINLEKLNQKGRKKYLRAWYAVIPDHCICSLIKSGDKGGMFISRRLANSIN